MIGKKLGHYEITGRLGAGGMGEVFRARDTKLGREVALKILPPEIAGDPQRVARFRREALAVAALKHPNIVTLYAAEEAEGQPFLTMELVEGGTLRSVMRPRGIPLDRFFDLAIPLAQAISSAHDKGITHRDLKPANILLDEEGRPKVLDFGLARMIERTTPEGATAVLQPELTTDGTVIGTIGYMSPEQAEGRETDARSDIFSLGVILYELATGTRPFEGDTSAKVLTSLLRDEPVPVLELRADLPHHLGRILRRCLAKDPAERYQTARDLYNELRDLRAEVTLESQSGASQAPEPRSARPRLLVAAGVVLVVAAFYMFRGGTPEPGQPGGDGPIRVVVLPLENLGNADDGFFADGMTEELTNRLSTVDGLGVISRQSARGYAGRDVPVQEIGEELDVQYVLAGSVRWARSGDQVQVRISPQLIRVADNTELWSGSFDRTLQDVFTIQSEISREVIRELGVALAGPDARELDAVPTSNPYAYELYMRGIAQSANYEEQAETARMLQMAVEADPRFARAWAALARSRSRMVHFGAASTDDDVARARAAAERALELAPGQAFPHVAMGFFHYHGRKDYAAAEREFARAAAISPGDPDMLNGLALVQRRRGNWAESTRNFEAAMNLNPRDPNLILNLLSQYVMGSRWPDAERIDRVARQLGIDVPYRLVLSGLIPIVRDGDLDEARRRIDAFPDPADPWIAELGGLVEIYDGNYEAALARIDMCRDPLMVGGAVVRSVSLYRGLIHQLMGNDATARKELEAAARELEQLVATRPDHFRFETALGVAYAALGRGAEARAQASRAVELFPLEQDYVWGTSLQMDVAMIHAILGDLDQAMVHAERSLSWPDYHTAERVTLDPWLKALTTQPGFKEVARRAAARRVAHFEPVG